MHIAVEGCSHGELETIYRAINRLEADNGIKIDLLLCCGDFQSVRNKFDLKCMAVPPKYLSMQHFHEYYSGSKKAPVLTIFIGGNHEASNFLQELPYGGWVAPNIYYLGYAGVVNVGGLRIGGMSGIYKGTDYLKGHHEKSPYDPSSLRSVYHIRSSDVFRIKQLSNKIDVFMSHDWPRDVYNHGDKEQLVRTKPFLRDEVDKNILGSRPAEDILKKIKPHYWFSGHLHVKFAAVIKHEKQEDQPECTTKFLALDKCLPRREFLQVIEIPIEKEQPVQLKHDLEWLTILRLTNHLLSIKDCLSYMPGPGGNDRYIFTPTPDELDETREMFGDLLIPQSDFKVNAPLYKDEGRLDVRYLEMPAPQPNEQTQNICTRLGIDDPMALLCNWSSVKKEFSSSTIKLNNSGIDTTLKSSNNTYTDENDTSGDIIFELSSTTIGPDGEIEVNLNDVSTPKREPTVAASTKITPLNLTKPKHEEIIDPIPVPEEKIDPIPVPEEEMTAVESGDPALPIEETLSPLPAAAGAPKKIKRRNADLYKANDDE